jgi:hypothetical protein
MKRISVVTLLMLIGLSFGAHAQDKKAPSSGPTFVSAAAVLSKVYTKEELEKLGKLELRNIYIECFVIASEIMPYLSLHTKPGATLKEMGIPETKENMDHLQNAVKSKKAYIDAVKKTLDDVIPYSDTKNIIWGILFFQDMITRAQEGGE